MLESLEFGIKVHDPAVSHGAADGNAEFLAREHGGRADCSADVGGSRAVNGSVHVVGAAGAKVGDEASLGSAYDAVGLGGDERLVIGLGQNGRLHELRVNGRSGYGEDGFVGVDDGPLGESVHIAPEMEIPEPFQKFLVKAAEGAEVVYVLVLEVEVDEIIDDLLEARENGVAAVVGILAVEEVEDDPVAGVLAAEIAVAHGHFVEVHHHAQVASV